MNRIMLLVENTENRKILSESLSPYYNILQGNSESIIKEDFDLCIIDGIFLSRYENLIYSKKIIEQPVFIPFVLVTSRQDIGMATRFLWKVIDDIVVTPIEKIELLARVNNLLETRELSLRFYKAILNSSPIGIILLDKDGIIKSWSLSAKRILGWKREDVLEKPIYSINFQNNNFSKFIDMALNGETLTNIELKYKREDEREIELEISISPVHNTNKTILYILLMLSDITERKRLERENIQNLKTITELYRKLEKAYDATIRSWGKILELRDKETEGHTERVVDLTIALAKRLGLKDEEVINIRRGAFLHDIGKLSVPDSILLKPGKLNAEEWEIIKKHPVIAYEALSSIEDLKPTLDIPYCHHENWDGTGYPRGLKGEEIPLSARIFAIADVWDALTSDRPYRPAWSKEEALRYIKEQAGKHFDPKIVEVFLEIIKEYL
ncbi:MAG: PAS domain S-box protein [bacterium]|nr:PAS domain S-box protein [bacterium]